MTIVRFSTDTVPQAGRREAIEQVYGGHVPAQLDFSRDTPIAVDMSVRQLADIQFASITTSPVVARHAADDDGLIYLGIATYGAGSVEDSGNPMQPGHINVLRRDRPRTCTVTAQSVMVSLAVPQALLAPRVKDLDQLMGQGMASSPASRLLEGYATALIREDRAISGSEATMLAGHVLDLACLALGATRDAMQMARGGLRAARLKAIKADIAANLGEPALSPGWLARRHAISESYIRALFYDAGTSLTDHVLEARLDYVRGLLGDVRFDHRTIAALALEAGFGDISWFNQVFRRRFSMAPSEMRRQGRQG